MIQSIRTSNEEPNEWGIIRKLGMPTLVLRFSIERTDTEEGTQYTYKEIIGNPGRATYDEFVGAVINFEYPYDKVEAIRNNYLLDGQSCEEHRLEFQKFQEFRDYAKSLVTRILEETAEYFIPKEPQTDINNGN